MIRVSRRTPPADDAAKARSIVESGCSAIFAGDSRQLRRIASLLKTPGVDTFLGTVEVTDEVSGDVARSAMLVVEPAGNEGAIVRDRVPR